MQCVILSRKDYLDIMKWLDLFDCVYLASFEMLDQIFQFRSIDFVVEILFAIYLQWLNDKFGNDFVYCV